SSATVVSTDTIRFDAGMVIGQVTIITQCRFTGSSAGAYTDCPIATGLVWTVTGTSLYRCVIVLSGGGGVPSLTSVTPSSTTITYIGRASCRDTDGTYAYTVGVVNE